MIFLYNTLKYTAEGIMVTLIVSISWGWSLLHLKHYNYYPIIGAIVTIANLVSIILDISAEQIEEAHHKYDGTVGLIILIIRISIFVLFIFGILRIRSESVGKRKHFINKFGIYGGIFLSAWPVCVIFCELFLPNYMHNEIVTVSEEAIYIITNAYICNLFAFPDSDYQKINIKNS